MNMFTPPGQADEQAWVSRINFEAIELQSRLNYFAAVASTATRRRSRVSSTNCMLSKGSSGPGNKRLSRY